MRRISQDDQRFYHPSFHGFYDKEIALRIAGKASAVLHSMDDGQFNVLISVIEAMRKEIVDKLEEIKSGIIDVEDEISRGK